MSHTATGEWKSFEIRMRRRRAERCAARADIDLARGAFDDARAALLEARRLAPDLPQLADLEESIETAQTAARVRHGTRVRDAARYMAIAMLFLATAVATIWAARHGPTIHLTSVQNAGPQTSSIADVGSTANQPQPAATPMSGPAPRVIVDQEPITVAEDSVRPPLPFVVEADATTGHASEPPQRPASPPDVHYTDAAAAEPTRLAGLAGLPVEKAANPSSATVARLDAVPIPSLPVRNAAALNVQPEPAPTAPVRGPSAANTTAESGPTSPAGGAAATAVAPHDDALVQQTLDRYATAYTRLDARAAQQVWPTVDREALARAFGGLALQRVSLGDCRIDVQGVAATAACAGTETWAPKIGAHGPHTAARNWTFELTKAGSDWQIVSARVQNNARVQNK